MLAALIALLMGPASVIYVLGPLAGGVLFLPLLGVQLGVTLGIGVTPGTFTAPDYVTAALVATLLTAYFAMLIYMTVWNKLEVYFCTMPWLRHNGDVQGLEGTRKYATRCPFTGHRPTMRCPSCEARVHDSAFHKSDRLVSFPIGETVLRWDGAKQATEMEGSLKKARRQLDKFLDFRGNTLFATLSACCVGCATWQRCFNLLPRMSLVMAFCSLFFAFLPWAFANFLAGDNAGSSSIGDGAAKAAHVISDILAVMFAEAGFMVQLHALLRTNDFLTKYRAMIPSLRPVFRMPHGRLMNTLLRAPWEQAV